MHFSEALIQEPNGSPVQLAYRPEVLPYVATEPNTLGSSLRGIDISDG
jgi:hypothetical protein